MTTTTETIIIHTDGGCKGNPGPGGWGAIIRKGSLVRKLYGGEPDTTNNQMELMAVIKALEALKRLLAVEVYTDSQYVQKGISEWIHNWKRNGWRTSGKKPVKNADLWERIDALANQHQVKWCWVKGHAVDPWNERADALAKKGFEGPSITS